MTREADQRFRKIIGYSDLARLAILVERDLAARRTATSTTTTQDGDTLATVS
jgi:hypothetical protein